MAKNDGTETTTAAEDVAALGLTDSSGAAVDAPLVDRVSNPARAINIQDTKTLKILEQENDAFARSTPNPVVPYFPSTVKILRGPGGSQVFYEGSGLVDENNSIARPNKYAADQNDIYTEFFRVTNTADRNALFSTMQKLGYYEGKKPSAQALQGLGLAYEDRAAIEAFMMLANSKGRTMKALVNLVAAGKIPTAGGTGGSGRTISVVSREDAAKQTGNAFFELLGRAATPAEVKIAVQAIQDMDRKRQLSNVENPTTLGVAAEQQAMKASPGEFGAYSAGKAINQIFSLLGGA